MMCEGKSPNLTSSYITWERQKNTFPFYSKSCTTSIPAAIISFLAYAIPFCRGKCVYYENAKKVVKKKCKKGEIIVK